LFFKQIVDVLGKDSREPGVTSLPRILKETPVISQPYGASRYTDFFRNGVSIASDPTTKIVFAVFLYGIDKDGYSRYARDLPNDINFEDRRLDVRRKMGRPIRVGKVGKTIEWDLYNYGEIELHFQYDKKASGCIALVTLQLPGDQWQKC